MDVWLYSHEFNTWTNFTTAIKGPCPSPRFQHATAYDPINNVLYVHGGLVPAHTSVSARANGSDTTRSTATNGFAAVPTSELWSLSLNSTHARWTLATPLLKPSARFDHDMVLLRREWLYIFYGKQTSRMYPDDLVWYYDIPGTSWHKVDTRSMRVPQPRSGMTAVAFADGTEDPTDTRSAPTGTEAGTDTGTGTGTGMSDGSCSSSSKSGGDGDNFVNSVIFFGGETELTSSLGSAYKDSWIFGSLDRDWQQTSSWPYPVDRFHHAGATIISAIPTDHSRFSELSVLFGGFDQVSGFLNDLWALAVDDSLVSSKPVFVWTHIIPKATTPPSPRAGHTMVTLTPPWSDGQVLVVHGGRESVSQVSPLNDTHIFNTISEVWAPALDSGSPVARAYHSAVQFNHSGMVVYGGQGLQRSVQSHAPPLCPHQPRNRDAALQDHFHQSVQDTFVPLTDGPACEHGAAVECTTTHHVLSPLPQTTCRCVDPHPSPQREARSTEERQQQEEREEEWGEERGGDTSDYGLLGDVQLCDLRVEGVCAWTQLRVTGPDDIFDDGIVRTVRVKDSYFIPKPRSHHAGLKVDLPTVGEAMVIFGGIVGPALIPNTAAGESFLFVILR